MARFGSTTLLSALLVFSAFGAPASANSPPAAGNAPAVPSPSPSAMPAGGILPRARGSAIALPKPVQAPAGAPNVLLVMTDDVGFAAASTFGGPIPTPNLDRLAAQGLKYNQFHTTAICSPTRAALLTGRNHHAVSSATVVELSTPHPGYVSEIPQSAATVARILRDNGYNTAMFGKDHNVPSNRKSPAGPFDQWPTGRGFEYFYGFVGGDSDQWRPSLYEGITPVERAGEPDTLLDELLADRAIRWLHNQQAAAPDKPFFIYFATGSAHAPHQAPAEWIAKFRGQFEHGWDRQRELTLARQKEIGVVPAAADLAPRPAQLPAWESLSVAERAVAARYMEVYAAMLAYQDAQFGRLVDELERMGIADDTLVIFIQGDNGGSGEGGPTGTLNEMVHLSGPKAHSHVEPEWLARNLDLMGGPQSYQAIPAGWAFAMNTPFQWMKVIASHLGGTRNGLVMSWPGEMERRGEVRPQYHHVIDIMPTILDAANIEAPATVDGVEQQRIDGVSMTYSFDQPAAPSARRTQYYEMLGNRGIYHDGWLANTAPRHMSWNLAQNRPGTDTSTYEWELYNLAEDFSQVHNLAADEPDRLREMQALFDQEARRNQVYPIQDSGAKYRAMQNARSAGGFRTNYVYWGPDIRLPTMAGPPIFNVPFSLEADLVIPEGGAEGVIVAAGSHFGGWSFYLHDGKPVVHAAASQLPGMQTRVAARNRLPTGSVKLRYDVAFAGKGGSVVISVNGREVATGTIDQRPHTAGGNVDTFDTGHDANTPVTDEYDNEGVFTGEIRRVEVQLRPPVAASR